MTVNPACFLMRIKMVKREKIKDRQRGTKNGTDNFAGGR